MVKQQMGNLPSARVTPQRPFKTTGVDFCGPFHIRFAERARTTTKTYVAVFVCFATKAVHLEVVKDLSSKAFLDAFIRFTGRRGMVSDLYSDNATNFRGANQQMRDDLKEWLNENTKQQLSHTGTEWHYIPASAPHMGGLWESAVKAAKRHMYRIVGNQILQYEQLGTLVVRIEACLNSRPLVALHDDPSGKLALTPGDFLIGEPLIAPPEPNLMSVPVNKVRNWLLLRRLQQEFWQRWSDDYLTTLQTRNKWQRPETNPK